MFKHLQKLLLIALLCVPWVTQAQCPDNEVGCPITISGTDDYGDGWNGASISVYQGTTLRGSFTLSSGDSYTASINICTGDSVRLVWNEGSYDDECSFTVLNGDGTTVITGVWGDSYTQGQTIITFEPACPTCPQPSNLAAALTSNGIEVSWVANGTESSWLVYVNGEYEATVTSEEYTITSPTEGSVYSITVAAYCGVGDTSIFIGPITLTIPGAAITDYPYSTGFETDDDAGWSFENSTTNAWYVGSATNNGGTNSMYISNNNGTANAYNTSSISMSYAYRAFTVDDAYDMAVSFDWKCYGESNYDYIRAWIAPATAQFTAGQLPDGSTSAYNYTSTTPAGWIDLNPGTGKLNLSSNWQTKVSTFHVNAGTYYLVFMWANDGSGGSTPPGAIDNVILTQLTCAQPLDLGVDALQTSADFFWTPAGDESNWEVMFDNNNYYVTDTFYSATNLTANTPYTIAVRAICGEGDTSFWSTYSFRTPCDFIDTLPYINDFESASTGSSTSFEFGDPCWTINTDATQYPYVYISSSTTYNHTPNGGKGIYWYRSSSTGTYGSYQCLVLPGVDTDVLPLNTLQLKFWAKASADSYSPVFQVGVMTDPGNIATFTPINTVNVQGTTWTEYETFFAGYEGTGRYMAIRANYDGNYWYAYVDDVTIDLIPSCPHVASISVDSVSTEYLGISWVPSGEENEWIIYLNDSIIGNAVSTPEYEITDLSTNTIYSIGVRALCDGGDTSAIWTINGRTSAGDPISTFPYYCDFETDDDNNTHANDWILENGSQTNYWTIGTAASNSPSHSMYITDNGTANSYNGSSTSNVFAYAVFNFDTGEYAFSFDWKGVAESCCDYLRVALVPYASDLVAGASGFPGGSTTFGSNRNQSADWVTETNIFSITTPGLYKLAFNWHNDGSVGNNPPVAVDNIMVVRNTCPMPTNVHATYITGDSITIAWTPGGSETSWVVSDGINTYEVQSPDNAGFTFDQLSPSTLYHFTIQAVCADDDSSLYASVNVRTACGAITSLPLFEDFETSGTTSSSNNNFIPCWTKVCNATSYYYPYVSNSTTYNHTPGGAYGIYWYRSSTAGTYGDYNILVLPQLDTTALPLNTTMLTFWAKNSSTSYHPVIYVGTMQHPDSVSSFQTYAVFNDFSTDWTKYTVIFDNYEDTIGASYIAIRSNYTGDYWYLYVDDIRLDSIPDCSPVEDLVVEGGVTSAMVHWNSVGNSYTGATVRYKETGSSNWNTMTVTGQNYAVLTGLTPDTTYDVSVGTICGEDIASSVSATFETGSFPCGQFDSSALINVTVGQGATTNTYFPSYSFYNYGYSQQFYTAHEIGGAGVITSITLYPSAIAQQRTYEIYMGTYADSSSSTYVTPTGLTCVYNGGHIPLTAGQPVTFNLTTPFNYNGVSNLVVIFRDLTGSYVSGNAWYGDVAWSNVGQMNYQDGGAYSVPQSGTGAGSHASVNDFRNKITFFGGTCLQASTCAAPIPHVSSIGTTTVDLVWAPGNVETSWRLYYRQVGAANFTQAGTATTNSYQFTGLASGTNYEFMVVPVCADSISATTNATTNCAEITSLPFFENFNSWGSGSGVIPNCWYRTGSYSSYTYISTSYNHGNGAGGSLYMYQSGDSYHSAIFLPALDTTVYHPNQTQLVFHAMNYSASYMNPGFEVGVLSDPSDISTFVPVDTVYHTADINVWEIFEVPLANYTGDGAYVGLRTINNPYSTAQYTYTYFYMDDFTLELIPTCPRPDSLTATNATTNSVDLGWHERGNASNWIIEYGPIGFTPGTGTIVAANSNPFTLNGLPVAYQGEYYVKSVCSSTDTGEYSRMACAFGTSQIPATIPYNYDFESSTEFDNWQTCSNSTINWYRGTAVAHNSNYSMYVSADQGATYKPYTNSSVVNTAIYRDIDFGSIDSSFTISFDARVGGTLTASYDGLMVFLVDTSIAPVASSSNITSPWGNVNDLYRIATVRIDTVWHTYTASFDTISGIKRVAFFWFNQSTSSYDAMLEPAAVDNIHIDYSACPRPVATTVNAVSSSSANLSWTGPASATYEVIYRQTSQSAANNVFVQTPTNSITLTGLDPVTQYVVWVRKLCGNDTSLTSDYVMFTTEMCDNATWYMNYDSTLTTTTSTYSPIGYSFYNYGYTQTIVDSAYLAGMDGDIAALAFEPTVTTAGDEYENMTVYLANVPESDLSSGWILPDSTDHVFVKVIDGASFSYTSTGIKLHGFDTTFTWDGHSNILVSVVRNNGSYTSGATFAAHNHGVAKGRYVYQDSGPYDYTGPSSTGYTITAVGDIYFVSCGMSCRAPQALAANNVTYNSATLNWSGTATDYEIAVKAATDAEYPAPTAVSNANTYEVGNLAPATLYRYHVRAICDAAEGLVSDWIEGSFVTDSLPCFDPSELAVQSTGYTTATLGWTANGEESAWRIHVWNTTFEQTYDVTSNPATVTGLVSDVEYSAEVMAVCGGVVESGVSNTVTFRTARCEAPTNVSSSNITAHTAVVSWSGAASSYRVEYGTEGFGTGEGTSVTATGTTVTLTGLLDDQTYDVYVYAVCAEGLESAASQKHTFETTTEGIDIAGGMNVSIYPNPTTSATTVALSGVNGEVTITVVDMNGRIVMTESVSCDGDCVKRMDVEGLAQGAYFVRVSGENLNMVKKLVVK